MINYVKIIGQTQHLNITIKPYLTKHIKKKIQQKIPKFHINWYVFKKKLFGRILWDKNTLNNY